MPCAPSRDASWRPHAAELDREPRFPWPRCGRWARWGCSGSITPEATAGSASGSSRSPCCSRRWPPSTPSHAIDRLRDQRHAAVALARPRQRRPRGTAGSRSSRAASAIGAFCLTEPHAGSDAAALTTRATTRRRRVRARREQGLDHLRRRGATLYLVLAKTDPAAGVRGISAFFVEKGDTPGCRSVRPERKLGQHAAITTSVRFDDAFVPEDQRLGSRGAGLPDGDGARSTAAASGSRRSRWGWPGRRSRPRCGTPEERQAFGQADPRVPGRLLQARRHGHPPRGRAVAGPQGGLAAGPRATG